MAALNVGPTLTLDVADMAFLASWLPLFRSEQRRNGWVLSPSQLELVEHLERLRRARTASASVPIGPIGPGPEDRSAMVQVMTTSQAAARLGVRPRQVVRLIERGRLAGRMAGGCWQVDASSVDDLNIERNRNEQ